MSVSLYGRESSTLSPPPLSELSDSEPSPRSGSSVSSVVHSPVESPLSSRGSVNVRDDANSTCGKWRCCAAVSTFYRTQFSSCESFAALNLTWVLCSAFCWIFHNRLCNFFFRCGCTWNWAGSWDRYVCSRSSHVLLHRSTVSLSGATCITRADRDVRGVQRPVVSVSSSCEFRVFANLLPTYTRFFRADTPNFLWAADGKLFTLAMVGVAFISMRSIPIKSLALRLMCAASSSILTWFILCLLSALAFWQLTDYPYFMWSSKPPYPNQTDCTPNPCKSPV
jgi:hypothetical protein